MWQKAIPRRHDWVWVRRVEQDEAHPLPNESNPGASRMHHVTRGMYEVVDPKGGRYFMAMPLFNNQFKVLKPEEEEGMLTHWG